MFKGGRPGPGALRLCVLRTFQPARGGEAFGVLPGSRPRPYGVPMKTQSLVRRATPFVGIAAVFAVAVATGAAELLAFPLFLVVVISSALFDDRAQLLTVGAAASLAVLILSVIHLGPTSDLATAVFEVAVLAIVAGSVHEVVRHVRAAEGSAERKAVELESDDARLHMVMEAATIGLGVVAHDGRWLQANERLAAILGRGKGELTQVGLLDVTAAGDRHAVEDALGQLSRGEIVRWEGEVQQTSPHGRPIPVSLAIAALSDQSNEPMLVQVTDISARKRLDAMRDALVAVRQVIELLGGEVRHIDNDLVTMLSTAGVEIGQFIHRAETAQALLRSEADHRAIYERSPIGIARVSSDGELLEGNPSLLHMLEHDMETMRSQVWPDLLRAYDQAAGRARLAPMLAGITDQRSVQVRAATGGGRWLWLQLTATSIPDTSGRPEHVLVMVEDVTTVRETQDKLAEALDSQRGANTTLEKLDRTKTEFLSIVSHEFRTALTGIQGFSELIRDGGLESDEVRAYGGYIFNDADRVNRLIGDMLDLDRMESGRMSIRLADVDINEVVNDVMTRAASSSSVVVEFKADFDPRLPTVTGDRDRLVQVVSNLVNNAVKYSPDGGTVTLS